MRKDGLVLDCGEEQAGMNRQPRTRPLVYRHWLFLVTLTSLAVPEWAYALQPREFERVPQEVWVPRFAAKVLAKEDREDGGAPTVIKAEYRRCYICGRLTIQMAAARRRRLDGSAMTGKQKTCGYDCASHMWAQKARRQAEARVRRAAGK
jgi:hypothetical protein